MVILLARMAHSKDTCRLVRIQALVASVAAGSIARSVKQEAVIIVDKSICIKKTFYNLQIVFSINMIRIVELDPPLLKP